MFTRPVAHQPIPEPTPPSLRFPWLTPRPAAPPLMARLWKTCTKCATPYPPGGHCPQHPPPDRTRQSWSADRDHASHKRLRRQVIKERPNRCQHCGKPFGPNGEGIVMHHLRKGDRPENVILVHEDCHTEIDNRARKTKRA